MNCKDIWFVRHTETVTPDSYDFDLSAKGKRQAQWIGWYMARQGLLKPAVLMYWPTLRSRSMIDCMTTQIRGNLLLDNLGQSNLGNSAETFQKLLSTIWDLDRLAPRFDGITPQSAIFIIHRQFAEAFDLFRFFMASPVCKDLLNAEDEKISAAGRHFKKGYDGYDNGETVRMRFAVSTWGDIRTGEGEIIEHILPNSIRNDYRNWRRSSRLAL